MPKTALDPLAKWQRLDMLRRRFHERVRLTSAEVRAFYANLAGEDSENLRRQAHRDLDTLIDEGFLRVFDSSDETTEITGDIPPGTKALYALAEARDRDIVGSGKLLKLGGKLLCSRRIQSAIRLESGFVMESHSHSMILDLPGGIVSLVISKEDLPVRIVISRMVELISPNPKSESTGLPKIQLKSHEEPTSDAISNIERAGADLPGGSSKRVALLLLPVSTLSAYKGHSKLGHCVVDFKPDEILVTDLNSKNQTLIGDLTKSEVEEMQAISIPRSGGTASARWNHHRLHQLEMRLAEPLKAERLGLPAMIQASKDLKIIIS